MKANCLYSLVLLLGLFTGCRPDPCDYVACGVGECVEGICDCPEGFTGENCEIEECFGIVCANGDCDSQTESCLCNPNYYGEGCDTLCVNGEFEHGACHCGEGYEGSTCETEIRERFIGTWDVLQWTTASPIGGTSVPGYLRGAVRMKQGYTILEVELYCSERHSGIMLFSSDERIYGTVKGDSIAFEAQEIFGERTVYGSASLDAGILSLELYFSNPRTLLTEEAKGTFLKH